MAIQKTNSVEEKTSKTTMNIRAMIIEIGIQLIILFIVGIVSLIILKIVYYGFDFSRPYIMINLVVIPYLIFSVFFRGNVLAKYPQNDQKKLYVLFFIITMSVSLLLFEFGLYFLYCDGIFAYFSDPFC